MSFQIFSAWLIDVALFIYTVPPQELKWIEVGNFWNKQLTISSRIVFLWWALNFLQTRSKTPKPRKRPKSRKFFSQLFLFRLFDFGLILKIQNSENKFWRFRVFHLPLFDLSFSSDRLSFFTLNVFFCFLFLLCLNLLF